MTNKYAPKKTLGLLVGGIVDHFTEDLCKSVMHAISGDKDINLVVFPGKYIYRDYSVNRAYQFEYQYNTLFAYSRADNLDGVIIAAGSIGSLTNKENNLKFLESFQDIPNVIVAADYDGYISVNYDNRTGIYDAMDYLINKLGCTKICMLGGPDDNFDARERKNAYLSALEENGVAFEERFFVAGDLSENCTQAFNLLLDQNPDAEAVFCVNDVAAIGLYEVMKSRGIMPGRDIKVFGHDNEIMASQTEPSLSSIDSDSMDLGIKAVEIIKKLMNGEKADSAVIPTRFIARNSFGTNIDPSYAFDISGLTPSAINQKFEEIFYRYRYEGSDREKVDLRRCFYEIVSRITDIVVNRYVDEAEYDDICNLIDIFFRNSALDYTDADCLLTFLKKFHGVLSENMDQCSYGSMVDMLFDRIRENVIHVMGVSYSELKMKSEKEKDFMKVFASKSLNFKHGSEHDFVALLRHIGWLGVKNASMYLFKEPMIHMINEFFLVPEYLYLKAVCREGEVFWIPYERQKKNISEIFSSNNTYRSSKGIAVLPIFYEEYLYGIILCDLTDMLFENGEFIASQLGASVRMLYLLKSNDELAENLEKANHGDKPYDEIDSMTGAYSKDAYFKLSDDICKADDSATLITGYVTLNHLKIINARFGHDEGDFAIKTIPEILKRIMGEDGHVGRTGGDEFSFIYSGTLTVSGMRSRIADEFWKFNQASDKPFNVLVSVGISRISYGRGRNINEALAAAGEELYIDKINKDIFLLKDK